jgi:hypothetical protein
MSLEPEDKTEMLRHTVATLAYRGERALCGAPAEFATFGAAVRTPGQILAHLGDLLDWTLALANGTREWQAKAPLAWEQGTARFFAALESLDKRLASGDPLRAPAERLFQGPIADALTHVGQIAMLRRLAGSPLRGENYFQAEIVAGRVGREQAPAKVEF